MTTIVDKGTVVEAIHAVNKQIFIEHDTMVPIVYSEVPKGWIGKLGLKQEMVVIIRGKASAGFDLSQLDDDVLKSLGFEEVRVIVDGYE
ncbi:MAG: hypothetical protein B6I38_10400 [Anaerolineaceae bacterium 4572_5.1]|nr:MAG: hypothetical protein B6I38_10400 [Anaerolineaceae bacterium 4572_5.1]